MISNSARDHEYTTLIMGAALSSDQQDLSCEVCLEIRGEIVRTILFVLCTEAVHSHKHT